MTEEATVIAVSRKEFWEQEVGEIKNELPKGTKTLVFLCAKCSTYIRRDLVTVGDDVFEVNLSIICNCGNAFLLAIRRCSVEEGEPK